MEDEIELNIQELESFEEGRAHIVYIASQTSSAQGSDPANRSKTYLSAVTPDYGLSKDDYRDLVILCRNIVKDEPLIRQFVEFHQGLCAQGMENKFQADVKPIYRVAFNSFARRVNEGILSKNSGLDAFQRKFCYEYWVSGMVVTLERVAPMKMAVTGARTINYKVPVELDILDPLRIDLDNLYKTNEVYYDIDDAIILDVKNNGVNAQFVLIYPDKVTKVKATPDNPNPYQPKSKADIVKLINNGATSVPLPTDKVRVYIRKFDDYSVYPLPFLSSILTSLADKAMLAEADRSIMKKLINMMLVYKIGRYNNQGQKTNVEDKIIRDASTQFGRNLSITKDGRVMVLFVPDTHELKWENPDTDNVFSAEKYKTADLGVLSGLYGVAGPQIISSSGNVDNDLFFKIVRSQNELFLNIYKRFIEGIYASIVEWNNMKFDPTQVNFKAKRLTQFDTKEFIAFRANLTDKNQISIKTTVEEAGEDFESEKEQLIAEKQMREELGIFTAIPTFSQSVNNSGTTPNTPSTETTTQSTKSTGRPQGVTETKTRAPKNAP